MNTPETVNALRVGSSDLIADLERRCDAAWDELTTAMQKAEKERQIIEAPVKRAELKWQELYAELKATKSAIGESSHAGSPALASTICSTRKTCQADK